MPTPKPWRKGVIKLRELLINAGLGVTAEMGTLIEYYPLDCAAANTDSRTCRRTNVVEGIVHGV